MTWNKIFTVGRHLNRHAFKLDNFEITFFILCNSNDTTVTNILRLLLSTISYLSSIRDEVIELFFFLNIFNVLTNIFVFLPHKNK